MPEKNLYINLKEKGLTSVLPPSTESVLLAESERNLYELAHTSSARRESLMSGLAVADGSIDQFGQPVGRFIAQGELLKATDELSLIESTWRQFHSDAIAADDQTSADFVVETVLQHFGFDLNATTNVVSPESAPVNREWITNFSAHCLSTEARVFQYIYWPVLLSDKGTLCTDKSITAQNLVQTGINLGTDDLNRCFNQARIAGRLNDDDVKKIGARRNDLEHSKHLDVGPMYVCLGVGPNGNYRLSFVGAFSKEINNRVRTLSSTSVITFEVDSVESVDLVLNQLDPLARLDDAGTSQNRRVIFELVDKFYPEEASKSMKEYFTEKFEIIEIRDNRNLAPPPVKVAPPKY